MAEPTTKRARVELPGRAARRARYDAMVAYNECYAQRDKAYENLGTVMKTITSSNYSAINNGTAQAVCFDELPAIRAALQAFEEAHVTLTNFPSPVAVKPSGIFMYVECDKLTREASAEWMTSIGLKVPKGRTEETQKSHMEKALRAYLLKTYGQEAAYGTNRELWLRIVEDGVIACDFQYMDAVKDVCRKHGKNPVEYEYYG